MDAKFLIALAMFCVPVGEIPPEQNPPKPRAIQEQFEYRIVMANNTKDPSDSDVNKWGEVGFRVIEAHFVEGSQYRSAGFVVLMERKKKQ